MLLELKIIRNELDSIGVWFVRTMHGCELWNGGACNPLNNIEPVKISKKLSNIEPIKTSKND
jgi:hypothetical protein